MTVKRDLPDSGPNVRCSGDLNCRQADLLRPHQHLDGTGADYQFKAGTDYVLVFNESQDGFFNFDLRFEFPATGSTWSCRVRTTADEPFIAVDDKGWQGRPGVAVANLDRGKLFLSLRDH